MTRTTIRRCRHGGMPCPMPWRVWIAGSWTTPADFRTWRQAMTYADQATAPTLNDRAVLDLARAWGVPEDVARLRLTGTTR